MVFYHIELYSSGNTFKVERGRRRWIGLRHCPTTASIEEVFLHRSCAPRERWKLLRITTKGPGGDKDAGRAALTGRERGCDRLVGHDERWIARSNATHPVNTWQIMLSSVAFDPARFNMTTLASHWKPFVPGWVWLGEFNFLWGRWSFLSGERSTELWFEKVLHRPCMCHRRTSSARGAGGSKDWHASDSVQLHTRVKVYTILQ